MSKAGWRAFWAVQFTGVLGTFSPAFFGESILSLWLWAVGFIALLPGNVVSDWLVEKVLRGAHLNPVQKVLSAVAVNGLLWLTVAKGLKLIRRRNSATTAK